MREWEDDVSKRLHARHRRGLRYGTVAGLVASALGVAACGGGTGVPAELSGPAPITVQVATATVVDRVDTDDAGGVVQANVSTTVSSRVLAVVRAVHVVAGDRVRAGQLLVTLDNRDLAATAAQGRSSVTAGEHAVRAAHADREGAEAALALAEASLGRVQRLADRKSATAQELDEATAAMRSARSRVAGALAHAEQAAAALTAARAASDATTVTEGFARITAPFSGRVTEKLVEPGTMAAPGAPLLRVESLDGWRVDVRVDESRVAGVSPGQQVTVRLGDAEAGVPPLVGTVTEVARTVDVGDRSFLVKVRLPAGAAERDLRSGIFARVGFPGAARRALVVPSTAIVRRGQVATVFVIENDLARVRLVETGGSDGAATEIRSGLDAGERVVASPPPSIRDRSPVAQAAALAVPRIDVAASWSTRHD